MRRCVFHLFLMVSVATASSAAQAAYRAALIDVIAAYTGAGIADTAAADLTQLAQP